MEMSLNRSYRRGSLIVLATIAVSALLAVGAVRLIHEQPPRVAEDLTNTSQALPAFRLVDSEGKPVTQADFADRVCIVSFIFTRCQLSCPRISSIMKSMQEKLQGTSVLLVSLTVDPEHDTPAILQEYGKRFGANPDQWWFLTGDRLVIYPLIEGTFKLGVQENPAAESDDQIEEFTHSDRLALLDRGKYVGLYNTTDPTRIDALLKRAKRLSSPAWILSLPSVNAGLNALCAVFLLCGWFLIRSQTVSPPIRPLLSLPGVRGHIVCMVLALLTSALFLGSYLFYHYHAGSKEFPGTGLPQILYFTILISHTLLATFGVVPLVILTLFRAIRKDFLRHRLVAATTFPIWLYVSITGVLIYFMLYHFPASTPLS